MQTLATATLSRALTYDESDHYGFMLLLFYQKHSEHLDSIVTLVERGLFRDATTIARVMIEGLSIIIWSANDREQRPLQWRAFSLVADWNLLQEKKAKGERVDPEQEERLKKQIARYGARYHTKRARTEGPDGLQYPFQKTWLLDSAGKQITRGTVFDEIRGADLYYLYEDFSQWMHWTPSAFGDAIARTDEKLIYNPNAFDRAAQALVVAFHAMLQTTELFYEHFKLECTPTAQELRADFLADIELEI